MPEPTCDPVHPRLSAVAVPLAAPQAGSRVVLRGWAIAMAAAVVGVFTLGAQAPMTDADVPLAIGARRLPPLEPPVGGSGEAEEGSMRVYHWPGPIEPLFDFYRRRLSGGRDIALDTASVPRGMTTAVSHHLYFHTFADSCADPATGAAAGGEAPATCKVWRRGKDKMRALNGRLGLAPVAWIERATFNWFSRDMHGDLVRWQVELTDTGLSANWQHYMPSSQITIERVALKRSAQ